MVSTKEVILYTQSDVLQEIHYNYLTFPSILTRKRARFFLMLIQNWLNLSFLLFLSSNLILMILGFLDLLQKKQEEVMLVTVVVTLLVAKTAFFFFYSP